MLASALRLIRKQEARQSRGVAYAEERWARFLLEHPSGASDLQESERLFRHAMTLQGGLEAAVPTLAHIGLARFALLRHETPQALDESAQALKALSRIRELYDVRLQAQVWLVRSQALLQAGDRAGALHWAQQALDARLKHDDPRSSSIVAARNARDAAAERSPP
jgi:hypothetical protein